MQEIEVSVFCGIGVSGNFHRVITSNEYYQNEEQAGQYSLSIEPHIAVYLPEATAFDAIQNEHVHAPRFFHKGKPVVFCGSGCIAAAAVLNRGEAYSKEESFDSGAKQVLKLSDGRGLSVTHRGAQYSMSMFFDMRPKNITKKPWESLLGVPVLSAVQLVDTYVVLELESQKRVAQLCPNFKAMLKQRAPALIITARVETGFKEDYVMRYFAPCYGNNEDMATGSANMYLMKYWQLKLNKKRLKGRQLSKGGGLFSGEIKGKQVILSGKVLFQGAV